MVREGSGRAGSGCERGTAGGWSESRYRERRMRETVREGEMQG